MGGKRHDIAKRGVKLPLNFKNVGFIRVCWEYEIVIMWQIAKNRPYLLYNPLKGKI